MGFIALEMPEYSDWVAENPIWVSRNCLWARDLFHKYREVGNPILWKWVVRRFELEEIQTVFLETKKLYLRELSTNDEELILALDSDPEVMKYLTDASETLGRVRGIS